MLVVIGNTRHGRKNRQMLPMKTIPKIPDSQTNPFPPRSRTFCIFRTLTLLQKSLRSTLGRKCTKPWFVISASKIFPYIPHFSCWHLKICYLSIFRLVISTQKYFSSSHLSFFSKSFFRTFPHFFAPRFLRTKPERKLSDFCCFSALFETGDSF